MLFEKHMRKYYLRYSWLYLIGIVSLVAVDTAQVFIPGYLGDVVNIVTKQPDDALEQVSHIILMILVIALVMFLGRMLWRFALFNASGKIEGDFRHEMFLKSERCTNSFVGYCGDVYFSYSFGGSNDCSFDSRYHFDFK